MFSHIERSSQVRKVLIVDDSNTERLKLKQIMQGAGYQTTEASSGNEAQALAKQMLPDLILLDIIMDDGDGYQACRALKRQTSTQHIPVIMVSSKKNPVDRAWAEKQGANGYVIKPFSAEDILNELAKL